MNILTRELLDELHNYSRLLSSMALNSGKKLLKALDS